MGVEGFGDRGELGAVPQDRIEGSRPRLLEGGELRQQHAGGRLEPPQRLGVELVDRWHAAAQLFPRGPGVLGALVLEGGLGRDSRGGRLVRQQRRV